jgi:ATP-binding cassette subfamily F protein 3
LKALADKQIPGVPWSLRILLLGQTRNLGLEEAIGGLDVREETVLEHVLRSDAVRERLLKEARGTFAFHSPFFSAEEHPWDVE